MYLLFSLEYFCGSVYQIQYYCLNKLTITHCLAILVTSHLPSNNPSPYQDGPRYRADDQFGQTQSHSPRHSPRYSSKERDRDRDRDRDRGPVLGSGFDGLKNFGNTRY
jgi:hypothetical protein